MMLMEVVGCCYCMVCSFHLLPAIRMGRSRPLLALVALAPGFCPKQCEPLRHCYHIPPFCWQVQTPTMSGLGTVGSVLVLSVGVDHPEYLVLWDPVGWAWGLQPPQVLPADVATPRFPSSKWLPQTGCFCTRTLPSCHAQCDALLEPEAPSTLSPFICSMA